MKHLTESQIASFLDNKLNREEKISVINHLSECEVCYNTFADTYFLLKEKFEPGNFPIREEIKKAAGELVLNSNHPTKRSFFQVNKRKISFSSGFAIASIIFMTVIITNKNQEKEQFRNESSYSSINLIFPKEGTVVNAGSLSFKWEEIDGALNYRIKIYNDVGKVLIDTTIDKNKINLHHNYIFHKGHKYFWDINAIFSNGKTIPSRLNAFKVE